MSTDSTVSHPQNEVSGETIIASVANSSLSEEAVISISDAYRFFDGVSSNFDALVGNLQVFAGLFSVLFFIAVLAFYILYGQDGQRSRVELQRYLERMEAAQKEAIVDIKDRIQVSREDDNRRFEKLEYQMFNRIGVVEREGVEFRREIKGQLDDSIRQFDESLQKNVERLLLDKTREIGKTFVDLEALIQVLQEKFLVSKEMVSAFSSSAEDADINGMDPYFNYAFVSSIQASSNTDKSEENKLRRLEAVRRLEGTISRGLKGEVDSNLLFKSGMAASRLEFEDQALKLLTLAHRNSPTPSHSLAKYRLQMTLGRAYAVDERNEWNPDERKPSEITQNAFTNALSAASAAPLPQNEIIYAELWNMSQKVREDRGYERMLDTLVASFNARRGEIIQPKDFSDPRDQGENFDHEIWKRQKGWVIPSNLAAKISSIYALIGTGNWKEKYLEFRDIALSIASTESSMTTWRKSTLRDMRETAGRIDALEDFNISAANCRIDLSEFEEPLFDPREILGRLQAMQAQDTSLARKA